MNLENSSNIKVFVTENYEEMSKKAAEVIAEQIRQKPNSVMGFATGGTPLATYKELIKMYNEGKVDFSQVTSFNLDEYYPLKRDNDQSYYYFMHENLFKHINIKKENINLPNGEAENWEEEVKSYEAKIAAAGGIDFQILGIGNNGHIAFNEPADTFSRFTSLVSITEDTIKANARFFEKEEDVPKKALSMGIRSIMMAKKILLIASGANKADVIDKALNANPTPQVPATILQFHRDVVFVIDKDASK